MPNGRGADHAGAHREARSCDVLRERAAALGVSWFRIAFVSRACACHTCRRSEGRWFGASPV